MNKMLSREDWLLHSYAKAKKIKQTSNGQVLLTQLYTDLILSFNGKMDKLHF